MSKLFALLGLVLVPVAMTLTPPTWPPPITAMWPVRWASLSLTADFPLGPAPFNNVTVVSSWWYDWPTNRWRQDSCTKMAPDAPPQCKIDLWDGNNHKAGSSSVGTTFSFTPDLSGNCTYVASMVPAITHPDSFAKAHYGGRHMIEGQWADTWISDTSHWIHYNFSTSIAIDTGLPLRDCGPTIPSPPWGYACSRHHHPKFAEEYSKDEWSALFALDTSSCKLAPPSPPPPPHSIGSHGPTSPPFWPMQLLSQHAHA